MIDAYYTALAAHNPSTLPLASNVKFTENGKEMTIGTAGLWTTAGMLKYKHSALDTVACMSVSQSVVPDGMTDIPVSLRLRLVNQQITEVETIAVRAGDYVVSGQAFASDTMALIASNATVMWEQPVPAGQANTRDELSAWMDKYYRSFPNGVCNTTSDCKRLENGGGSFNCMAGAMCTAGAPSGTPAITPRLILADEQTGIGVGFGMFFGNTDSHMFKMYGGQVHEVSAILGQATSSGWN
jgi:hypothetical protein